MGAVKTARTLSSLAALALAGALISGCSGDDSSAQEPSGPTGSTATTTKGGTTAPGTTLRMGKSALVRFTPKKGHSSLVSVEVTKVRKGAIKDLKGFSLDKRARQSNVYYVDAVVRNSGHGSVGAQTLQPFGLVGDDLVVPPVIFGSPFPTCQFGPLPQKFRHGARAGLCMVMLAPDHGRVTEIQWRGNDDEEPISWPVRQS